MALKGFNIGAVIVYMRVAKVQQTNGAAQIDFDWN